MSMVDFKEVFEEELKRIKRIRLNKNPDVDPDKSNHERLTGLALSGGGIRSAAFNLGVLQALANKGALEKFDYLSTVSGGGYIGSALTWFLSKEYSRRKETENPTKNDEGQNEVREFGTSAKDHPLGRKGVGAKLGSDKDNERIDHIRSLGNYLRPTRDLWTGSAAAIVLRNVVLAVLLWFLPLVFVLALVNMIGDFAFSLGLPILPLTKDFGDLDWLFYFTPIFVIVALLPMGRLGSELADEVEPDQQQTRYFKQLGRQRHAGLFMSLALVTAILASFPTFLHMIREAGGVIPFLASSVSGGGLLATFYGILGGSNLPRTKEWALKIGVSIVVISLLLFAYWLGLFVVDILEASRGLIVLLILAVICIVFGANVALNHLSLHRFYRDRLMEAFLPDPSKQEGQMGTKWRPALSADKAQLSDMCDADSRGPYHLINANAIMVGSEFTTVRNRGGENFILSPLYVGSDCTQWAKTESVYDEKSDDPQAKSSKADGTPRKQDGLQLSTAMSISGAAANPNSGPGGKGLTRSAIVSRFMMLLNIRLAYWIPNPNRSKRSTHWIVALSDLLSIKINQIGLKGAQRTKRAVFTYPGVAALAGKTHQEDSGYLELSDGGHFENLGIYELIRRRVPLIIVSDAGQDEHFAFTDLSNAIRRVQIDFGVKIRFQSSPCGLDGIRPDPDQKMLIGDAAIAAAERGWALAEIEYPENMEYSGEPFDDLLAVGDRKGCLVYLKPTMRPELPSSVVGYRAEHPHFPHQTTADQFFDEAQFEAYRELGYVTGKNMLVEYEGIRDNRPGAPKGYDDEPLRLLDKQTGS